MFTKEKTKLICAEDELIGKVLNSKYKIDKLIGQGGMGKVYLSTNIQLGNKWAVKQVSKNNLYPEYVLKEEEILKKFNHISLPQIVDVFYEKEFTYIVETYIEGINLDEKLKKEKKLDSTTVLDYFIQLTKLLFYLHSMKPYPIIYRDMKPQNIIITNDNHVVLVDFGISKENKYKEKKYDTYIAGTNDYAAPEQLILGGFTDQRTDIYSLGLIMYLLLNGSLPDKNLIWQEFENNENELSLKKIIEKCINNDYTARYQSAKELLQDLKKLKSNSISNNINTQITNGTKIILIDGTKGTGKTTILSTLARIYLKAKIPTCIVDLTYEFNTDGFWDFNIQNNLEIVLQENDIYNIKKLGMRQNELLHLYKGEAQDEEKLISFILKLSKFVPIILIDINNCNYKRLYELANDILIVSMQEQKYEQQIKQKLKYIIKNDIHIESITIVINQFCKEECDIEEIKKDINYFIKKLAKKKIEKFYVINSLERKLYLQALRTDKGIINYNENIEKQFLKLANDLYYFQEKHSNYKKILKKLFFNT